MTARKLSPAEENEARKAFAMLQNKKLLTVNKHGASACCTGDSEGRVRQEQGRQPQCRVAADA